MKTWWLPLILFALAAPVHATVIEKEGFRLTVGLPDQSGLSAANTTFRLDLSVDPSRSGYAFEKGDFRVTLNLYREGVGGGILKDGFRLYLTPDRAFLSYDCGITPLDPLCRLLRSFANATLGVNITLQSPFIVNLSIHQVPDPNLQAFGVNTTGAIGTFAEITADAPFDFMNISIFYNETEVLNAGVEESTLRMFRWNGTAWVQLNDTRVDTVANVVFGNVTGPNLSIFAPIGKPLAVFPVVSLNIDPDTLNLKSEGRWITAIIEIVNRDVHKINLSSVRLHLPNGTVVPETNPKFGFVKNPVGDHDNDSISDFQAKFDRSAVQSLLGPGNVTVLVTGLVGGEPFEGTAQLHVIAPGAQKVENTTQSDKSGPLSSHWGVSSGGGGSSGSVSTVSAAFPPPVGITKRIEIATPGAEVAVKIDPPALAAALADSETSPALLPPVTEIKLQVAKATSNIEIRVATSSTPPPAPPPPAASVYRFVEVELKNVEKETVQKAKIGFRVEKTWVLRENIQPDTVRLQRLTDGEWNILPTIRVEEDENVLKYEAETPGFSFFAITGDKQNQTVSVPASAAASTAPDSSPLPGAAPPTSTPRPPGFEFMLALIAISMAGLVYRRYR